jgi:hypothetical protein
MGAKKREAIPYFINTIGSTSATLFGNQKRKPKK